MCSGEAPPGTTEEGAREPAVLCWNLSQAVSDPQNSFAFLAMWCVRSSGYGGISQLTNTLLLFLKMGLFPVLKLLLLWNGGVGVESSLGDG